MKNEDGNEMKVILCLMIYIVMKMATSAMMMIFMIWLVMMMMLTVITLVVDGISDEKLRL